MMLSVNKEIPNECFDRDKVSADLLLLAADKLVEARFTISFLPLIAIIIDFDLF